MAAAQALQASLDASSVRFPSHYQTVTYCHGISLQCVLLHSQYPMALACSLRSLASSTAMRPADGVL